MDKQLEDLNWELGSAIQHRDAMTAINRRTPNEANEQARDEANRVLRGLRSKERSIQNRIYAEWAQ